MAIEYFAGTDARMFPQCFMLLQSFEEAGAPNTLRICDFGLSSGQRRFLASRGQLATPTPAVPKHLKDPWYHKAALVDFGSRNAAAYVWLDADMVVLTDPRPLVVAILDEMGRSGEVIAVSPDAERFGVGDFLVKFERQGTDVAPFGRLLTQFQIPPHLLYLNSGFFIGASRRWLKDWKKTTFETPPHMLFEQNAFNVTAWRSPESVRILDTRQWNVHGDEIGALSAAGTDGAMICRGVPAVVLHATSELGKHHERVSINWALPGRTLPVTLKLFRAPALRALQNGLFTRFVEQNARALAKYL